MCVCVCVYVCVCGGGIVFIMLYPLRALMMLDPLKISVIKINKNLMLGHEGVLCCRIN